jgi:DNA-binding MarR family transcriptional regulator
MTEQADLTDAQIAILEAIGRMESRENTAADIAAEAAVTPTTITRELNGLRDRKPSLVQPSPEGWGRTPDGELAVLEDVLEEEPSPEQSSGSS